MKMFMLKSFFILFMMFLFIFAGMKTANDGIYKMKGNSDHSLKSGFVSQEPNLHYIVDDDFSHNIVAKQQKLEDMNTFNLFSFMGNELSQGISDISKKMIKLVAK